MWTVVGSLLMQKWKYTWIENWIKNYGKQKEETRKRRGELTSWVEWKKKRNIYENRCERENSKLKVREDIWLDNMKKRWKVGSRENLRWFSKENTINVAEKKKTILRRGGKGKLEKWGCATKIRKKYEQRKNKNIKNIGTEW